MLFFCSVQFLRLTWSFLRSGSIKTHYITFKSLLAHVKFFAGVHENICSLQPTWPVKRIWHWQYCYGNQIRASSQQRHTKHIESVKRKHVFLDLCRKRVKKKTQSSWDGLYNAAWGKHALSQHNGAGTAPLSKHRPCDCRERQRDFYFSSSHA